MANDITAGNYSQEQLHAARYKAGSGQSAAQEASPEKTAAVSQQANGLQWEATVGRNGQTDFSLAKGDALYLSTIAGALQQESVSAPATAKSENGRSPRATLASFVEGARRKVKEEVFKNIKETYSQNYLLAELARLRLGAFKFLAEKLDISNAELAEIATAARAEKLGEVKSGIAQVVGERVLFQIVTGVKA
jgi:hypothetical protein